MAKARKFTSLPPVWLLLSAACTKPGWPKMRITDEIKAGRLPCRWYPTARSFDWQHPGLKVDWNESTASHPEVTPGPDLGIYLITIEGVEVLLPANDSDVAMPALQKRGSVKAIVAEAAKQYPRGPGEPIDGDGGYAQRLMDSDPRLAGESETRSLAASTKTKSAKQSAKGRKCAFVRSCEPRAQCAHDRHTAPRSLAARPAPQDQSP